MSDSYPWLKLHRHYLTNPQFMRLSEVERYRYFALVCLAGESDAGGLLCIGGTVNSLDDLAFALRVNPTDLQLTLELLESIGLMKFDGQGWTVTRFLEEQGPGEGAKREKWREQQQRHRAKLKGEENRKEEKPEREPISNSLIPAILSCEPEPPDDEFSATQTLVETITGIPAGGQDAVNAINQLVEMRATRDDIKTGVAWLISNGRKLKWISQVVGPTRTAMQKRQQSQSTRKILRTYKGLDGSELRVYSDGTEERVTV